MLALVLVALSACLGSYSEQRKYTLSVGALFKNEATILEEWIQHYLAEGVEHFYLVNDHSTDHYLAILSKYGPNKITLFDHGHAHAQIHNYLSFLPLASRESEWLFVVDLDEFVSAIV
jgi:hypothetical protein